MQGLFGFLFCASIVCFIVGLFKPSTFSRFFQGEVTRKKIASIFVVAIYAFFVLVNITTPHATNHKILSGLINFLFLGSIICLVLGLLKPSIFSYFIRGDLTREKIASIFGVATFAFLIVGVIVAPSVKTGKTATTTKENQVNVKTGEVALRVSNPPLIEATIQGRFEEVKRLLAEGANVNTEDDFGVTSLMQASQKGSVTLVQILLDRGADVTAKDRNGNTAMMLASRKGHHKVVNLLEEAYKDKVKQVPQHAPKVSSAPNVTQAQSNTKTKENQVALDSGKDIVKASKFSLIEAAEKGHLEEVKRILDEGADGNTRDDDGQTALMKAAKEGHVEIVKLLLNKGANVNSEDNYRRTALMLASFGGHHEVENLLKPLKDEKKNHVKGTLTTASRGIDDLELFMVNQGNTVIVTANTRSVLCKIKRDADMLILTSKQKDTAAMGDILARGLDLGTIADCPEGSKVYLINGVKNPGYFAGYNEHIMVVRPEGESELYFAFRKAFDHVPVASDEKEKKSK